MTKILCSDCKMEKDLKEFNKCSSRKTGVQAKCKNCEEIYRNKNKDKIKKRMQKYNQQENVKEKEKLRMREKRKNPEFCEKQRQYRINNKNKEKEYKRQDRIKNPEKYKERNKKWRLNNIEQYRKYQREYAKNKRATSIHHKMEHRLRNRLLDGLKKNSHAKLDKFWNLVDCTKEELKIHIESQFLKGMNWEIFMTTDKIEIDHIKPICSFDLSKLEDQKACFHWTNLRPLWKPDNKDKIKEDLKQSLILNKRKEEQEFI